MAAAEHAGVAGDPAGPLKRKTVLLGVRQGRRQDRLGNHRVWFAPLPSSWPLVAFGAVSCSGTGPPYSAPARCPKTPPSCGELPLLPAGHSPASLFLTASASRWSLAFPATNARAAQSPRPIR